MLTVLNGRSTVLQLQQRDRNVQWENVQFLNGGLHKYMHEYLIHSNSVYGFPLTEFLCYGALNEI